MSFVTAEMKRSLENHVLEEALPFGHGFLAYYMKEPEQGRMMSTLFVFTPEGIVIMGDLCPGGPGNRGSISNYNYGLGWFSRKQSEYYLCEKFLSREWQSVVAARFVREHMGEIKMEKDSESLERLNDWQDLLDQLDGGEMGSDQFHDALQDLDYEHDEEGYEYHLQTAGWLCALQQRFVELYAKLHPTQPAEVTA
jgi:hypothetical protein